LRKTPRKKRTKVVSIDGADDLVAFCENLIQLKDQAPGSLRLKIEVTAERDVRFRGGPPQLDILDKL